MPTKKMIAELDRCAAWLLSQPHAVKTTDMAKIAPPEVKDAESWARRMMRKMDETGRAMADDVDSRSGGVWWVHPKNDFRPPEEKIEDAPAVSTTVEIEPGPSVPLVVSLWNRIFGGMPRPASRVTGAGVERARARLKAKREANEAIPDPSATSRQVVRAEAREAHKRAVRPGPHNGNRFSWAGTSV